MDNNKNSVREIKLKIKQSFYSGGALKIEMESKVTIRHCSLTLIIWHSIISSLWKITFTSISSKLISNVNIWKLTYKKIKMENKSAFSATENSEY